MQRSIVCESCSEGSAEREQRSVAAERANKLKTPRWILRVRRWKRDDGKPREADG